MEDYMKFLNELKSKGSHKIYVSIDSLLDELKTAEKDGYNKALMNVMDNVKVKTVYRPIDDYSGSEKTIVDKQSILKLRRN